MVSLKANSVNNDATKVEFGEDRGAGGDIMLSVTLADNRVHQILFQAGKHSLRRKYVDIFT